MDPGTHLSGDSLHEALEVVRTVYGEQITLQDVEHIVITHAHFDHF
ncbi:MAG: MBL fold metallo-hydrolase, partial [Gammaproteobacteria bacterium]|nr:MBL fold metallo-hydrolase [Gammaproteobacteria bacterium]